MVEIHTKKWEHLVRQLKKNPSITTPEALATFKLGKRSFLKGHVRSRFKKVSKIIHRKGFVRFGYKRSGFVRKSYTRSGFFRHGTYIHPSHIKRSHVKPSRIHKTFVKASRLRVSGYKAI